MRYVLGLRDASSRSLAGGKGHGLHRLDSWGLDVPPASVVSTEAYRAVLDTPGVAAAIENLKAADNVRVAAAGVQSALRQAPLGEGLAGELEHAWLAIASSINGAVSVSCRSSATVEDSASSSFAGQFATVLGVSGVQGIADAVRECWASAWSPEVIAYCRTREIDPLSASMAVVVQRMVRADASGVAFSVNPVTGSASEVMINASWGLGETVVSGLVTPDTFLVEKSLLEIIARDVSYAKSIQHVLTGDGTVEERAVNPVLAASPALTDEQAAEVAALAVQSELRAGSPQDVEWAYEDGKLYVLQTRPVTTL